MNTPKHMTDEDISNLVELGLLPAKMIPEHPMAKKLYRDFRAGSKTMSKDEAYHIGSELDRLQARVAELEGAGASLVAQVLSARESLGKQPKQYVQIRPATSEEPADHIERSWPYEDEE
jgi:hypothetical protein